ncbi:MAG: pyridoxal phosphate-dependent aminotransferase family protein [Nitrospina sp.]|jgi:8-amino-7-oxononanoate synthase|nr:pyridoxal phosphate-dependent aminotransferase family protein [Nitrospina sp.]
MPKTSIDSESAKKIVQIKEQFDFESGHLRPPSKNDQGIFSKCTNYQAPAQAKNLGIYPYFREIEETGSSHVVIDGRDIVTISSNNYLGLAKDSRVIAAGRDAIEKFGIGCTGSRFLNGTLSLHRTLERNISSFLGREDSIVMSTGFQANQGTISCLLGRQDVAFSDRENHASIYEGCAIAQGKTLRYRHNDMDHLEHLLQKNSQVKGKLIITDSVFSMSGDIANLPEIVKIAKNHGASLLVDEAHGMGVLGDNGRGACEYFDVEKDIDIYVGTFSKSLGSIGGFVSTKKNIAEYIRHKASAFIFTAALPPASVAGVLEGLDILATDSERRKRLHENTAFIKRAFFELGIQVNNNPVPIVPIQIGDEALTLYMNRLLFDDGVFAGVAVSPVVPPLKAMIRTSYTSAHTKEDLDKILISFEKNLKKIGVLPQ